MNCFYKPLQHLSSKLGEKEIIEALIDLDYLYHSGIPKENYIISGALSFAGMNENDEPVVGVHIDEIPFLTRKIMTWIDNKED
jgi:hypothetical protein